MASPASSRLSSGDDPQPAMVRAPFSQRDVRGEGTDHGGIVPDTRSDGQTAIPFLANPRGVQYDAVTDDGSEDSSPGFFRAAARIGVNGSSALARPGDHQELDLGGEVRWMHVDVPSGGARPNPDVHERGVYEESGSFSASALFACRLSWQSVVFLGYGDSRTLSEEGGLPPENQQLFLEVSCAFQR